jgi:hypothetical protein
VWALATLLREKTDDSARILFEDHGRGAFDPFSGVNPSALLPLFAPGQYIGGPYLYTALKSNFTQCGDGNYFGHPVQSVDIATFERYATLYNIRWVVVWSRPMTRLARSNPDRFRPLAKLGYMEVFELTCESNWAVVGSARVVARPDRLEVSEAVTGTGETLVLSYHWIPTLRSSATLRPVYLEDDPVPFIAVDAAPRQFVIENRLW